MLFKIIKESSIGKEKYPPFMGLIRNLTRLFYSRANKVLNYE
jgi:hypothetical protein